MNHSQTGDQLERPYQGCFDREHASLFISLLNRFVAAQSASSLDCLLRFFLQVIQFEQVAVALSLLSSSHFIGRTAWRASEQQERLKAGMSNTLKKQSCCSRTIMIVWQRCLLTESFCLKSHPRQGREDVFLFVFFCRLTGSGLSKESKLLHTPSRLPGLQRKNVRVSLHSSMLACEFGWGRDQDSVDLAGFLLCHDE